jgi:hypothetical protein
VEVQFYTPNVFLQVLLRDSLAPLACASTPSKALKEIRLPSFSVLRLCGSAFCLGHLKTEGYGGPAEMILELKPDSQGRDHKRKIASVRNAENSMARFSKSHTMFLMDFGGIDQHVRSFPT